MVTVSDSSGPQPPHVTPVPTKVGEHEPEPLEDLEMTLPSPQTFFLGGLFTLSAFVVMYLASSIILPIVLAFVLKLLLQPAVRLLERLYLPRPVGALVAITLVIGSVVGLVAVLSLPAATWAQKLPEGIPRLEAHLIVLKAPIDALQRVIQQAEEAAESPGEGKPVVEVRRDLGVSGALFAGTRAILDGLFTTVLVLYFLLVTGEIFLRRFVEILPNFKEKRQAVDISQQVEEDISAYLVTITVMNLLVGAATAAAMHFVVLATRCCGVPRRSC
jgi:predicted PurR-regulated permease PerM